MWNELWLPSAALRVSQRLEVHGLGRGALATHLATREAALARLSSFRALRV
jgi:hypothetical protein